jgi:hypothetical protein
MSSWYRVQMAECQVDTKWQNVKLIKSPDGRMSSTYKAQMTKCQDDKISIWQNAKHHKIENNGWNPVLIISLITRLRMLYCNKSHNAESKHLPEHTSEVEAGSWTAWGSCGSLTSCFGVSQAVQLLTLDKFSNVQTEQDHGSGAFLAFRSLGLLQARQRFACPGFSRVQRLHIQQSSLSSLLLSCG